MREGDFHPTQHDPTVMSISVNELLSGCNRILLDQTQKNCTSLHRQCTAISISSTKNSFFAVYWSTLYVRGCVATFTSADKVVSAQKVPKIAISCFIFEFPEVYCLQEGDFTMFSSKEQEITLHKEYMNKKFNTKRSFTHS
jgi:hypothetical protein